MIRSGSPRSFDWTDPDETPLFAVFPLPMRLEKMLALSLKMWYNKKDLDA
jgi:hypothetical protein